MYACRYSRLHVIHWRERWRGRQLHVAGTHALSVAVWKLLNVTRRSFPSSPRSQWTSGWCYSVCSRLSVFPMVVVTLLFNKMHVSLNHFGKIELCHEQPQYSTDVVDQIGRTYEIHLFASRPSMPMRRGGAIRTWRTKQTSTHIGVAPR